MQSTLSGGSHEPAGNPVACKEPPPTRPPPTQSPHPEDPGSRPSTRGARVRQPACSARSHRHHTPTSCQTRQE
eukprot:363564-Chlamydomonas_euryale.AAC.11